MNNPIRDILEQHAVKVSAPCRIDLGGTVDISVFFYPLYHLGPSTFNIALDMRTSVRLSLHAPGLVKVSSAGFTSVEHPVDQMPFDHPLGLIFAIAAYFNIDGIHIEIDSSSPPKSALGGSSVAAVAVIAAFSRLLVLAGKTGVEFDRIPLLAHAVEESLAGVPCGCQDQLAAAYGGVNAFFWKGAGSDKWFERKSLLSAEDAGWLNERMLVSYCGVQHDSRDINSRWIAGFIDGTCRSQWVDIVECTRGFINAFEAKDVASAVRWMNRETVIRMDMTPDVVDGIGEKLVLAAQKIGCGARFTGAGGGGCVWALGEPGAISTLKPEWNAILNVRKDARLLDTAVDMAGVADHREV
ncbi:MAG: galactokinase [Desulfosalsimonadaceae bacterium]